MGEGCTTNQACLGKDLLDSTIYKTRGSASRRAAPAHIIRAVRLRTSLTLLGWARALLEQYAGESGKRRWCCRGYYVCSIKKAALPLCRSPAMFAGRGAGGGHSAGCSLPGSSLHFKDEGGCKAVGGGRAHRLPRPSEKPPHLALGVSHFSDNRVNCGRNCTIIMSTFVNAVTL